MYLIDTHCHLDFFKDPGEIISEAKRAGVYQIITPGSYASSSKKCVELSQKYPGVYAAVGLHPIDVANDSLSIDSQLLFVKELLEKEGKNIVAIGEVGLDFSPVPSGGIARDKDEQIGLLKRQVELAICYNLPIIIHNRKANDELIDILSSYKDKLTGVFHCFCGGKKFLKKVLDLGFYVGITGLLTYDSGLQEVVKSIPYDRLLLETDSPYLTPEPLRKRKRWPNTPKNVRIVAEKIAEVYGDSFLRIATQTSKNAKKLFGV